MSVQTLVRRPSSLPSVLDDFFEPWNDLFSNRRLTKSHSVPKVNISEDKNGYNLSVAAPGLQKKDFKVSVNGNILTISAENEANKETNEDSYTRQEYNYSSFSRSFTLPDDAEKDKVTATYDSGVLHLTLPRNGESDNKSQRTIEIK